eukprot:1956759-Pleurochrysis_carterae.AAC.4
MERALEIGNASMSTSNLQQTRLAESRLQSAPSKRISQRHVGIAAVPVVLPALPVTPQYR